MAVDKYFPASLPGSLNNLAALRLHYYGVEIIHKNLNILDIR